MQIPGFHLSLGVEDLPWRATSYPGIDWYLLASEGEDGGTEEGATVLIRMAPGRGYPAHRHLGIEEVLVLAGGYRDHLGEHLAGSYLRYPAGSEHTPIALGDKGQPESPANPACVLFACARGGTELLSQGTGE